MASNQSRFMWALDSDKDAVLSPLLFIAYMNWIDKCSQADEGTTIGNCKIIRWLFSNDLALLSSTESGLQRALNSFADSFDMTGIKTSTAKTEVLHLSKNPDQCGLHSLTFFQCSSLFFCASVSSLLIKSLWL